MIRPAWWGLLLWGWASACLALSAVDDGGQTVTLEAPPQRIVSLAPHTTELLFSLGLGDRIVGASEYSDFPPEARAIPHIGSHDRFDLERILSLQPDLVVAWQSGNGPDVIGRLRQFGLAVFALEPDSLTAVPDDLERLGQLTGRDAVAREKASTYRQALTRLTKTYGDRAPVRVFYQVWDSPLMTLAGDQYVTDAIRRCGGRNLFADLPGKTATVSVEAVLERRPQLILAAGDPGTDVFQRWRALGALPAVEYDQLVLLPPDTLARPTLRLVDGLANLCRAIDGARQTIHESGESST
ncbi:cobalamin-binding protein [Marinobacter sp. R17]|uniref:cobalamin-binding protein n=1 Tax=Marinobacter sp. R17 TaxID=2484250 RepID=UPI000FA8600C|nr:cobalamin-binding protein [Marinobacter sp. R17]ROT98886.1 cobalamin-binding protein [Marinobacter sp. R17]